MMAFGPTLLLLLVGEIGARAHYFLQSHDFRYWVAPFGGEIRAPIVYVQKRSQTTTRLDPCSGRMITFTDNGIGRGPAPSQSKLEGRFRIIAVGGSSTYGVNNPDEMTWPALLEEALRHRTPVEVLNAGQVGKQIEDFIHYYSSRWISYRPDMVIYYEGWNDTPLPLPSQVDAWIRQFHDYSWLGRWADTLYYRSMLYTLLLEKTQFTLVARDEKIVPKVRQFQARLEQFIRMIRDSGVRPVLVIQVMEPLAEPPIQDFQRMLRDIDLGDSQALRALILKTAEGSKASFDQVVMIRVCQTQVMSEVIRRTGEALGVQVIDPRPSFIHYRGSLPLFCDPVHLTDLGNRLLAEEIGEQLSL